MRLALRTVALGAAVIAAVLAGACAEPPATDATDSAPPASAAAVSASFDAGCAQGDESEQRHGTDCFCCHAAEFGVAGSVSATRGAVARIHVEDSRGVQLDMAPNPFGNFFRHARVSPPLRVTVYGPSGASLSMRDPAPSASCNNCHRAGGVAAPIHGVD